MQSCCEFPGQVDVSKNEGSFCWVSFQKEPYYLESILEPVILETPKWAGVLVPARQHCCTRPERPKAQEQIPGVPSLL